MTKQKKEKYVLKVLVRQLKLIKERKRQFLFIIYFLNMIASGLLPVLAIIMPKLIIDALDNSHKILTYIIIYSIISLMLAIVISTCKAYKDSNVMAIRIKEFERYNEKNLEIDYQYMEDAKFIDYLDIASQTLNSNYTGFEGTYHTIYDLLGIIISIFLYITIIGSFSIWLVLICLLSAVVASIVTRLGANYAYSKKEALARERRHVSYYNNTCYDFAYGKDIRLYNMQTKIISDYHKKTYSYISVFKNIKNHQFLYSLIELIMILLQDGFAYFLVIKAYFDQAISIGDVSMYIGAIIALSTALRTFGIKLSDINEQTRLSNDYFAYLDNQKYYSLNGKLGALTETLEIEFIDVSFKYPNSNNYIFKNLSFKIKKGEKVAIVGTNGAGKTTIIKLICGLFYPTSGIIKINGININDFNQLEYHKMFSVVFQDYQIYASTVIENVCGIDKCDSEIARGVMCIEKVGLKSKIESLPNGYHTPLLKVIEENGTELSGGQSQKLAIARALYKNGNMVILDEPTSALDALAEAEIYQDFDALVKNKTAIYVSHRLSSTKFCDRIAMFTKEGLKEFGTHNELMNIKGAYYHMFVTQGKYYQNGGSNNE